MKVVILNPTFVRLDLKPGDAIEVKALSPELRNLLVSTSAGGQKFARLENEDGEVVDDVATVDAVGETATRPRNRGNQRSPSIS